MVVWHYTIGQFFDAIRQSGVLNTRAFVGSKSEKPAVWFSASNDWDPSANKVLRHEDGSVQPLNKLETHERGGGLVRIGVELDKSLHRWDEYKDLCGLNAKETRRLYQSAIDKGARPGDWYASFEPVPMDRWVAIEFWNGSGWQNAPPPRTFSVSA